MLARAHGQNFSGARQHDKNRKFFKFYMLQQQKTTNTTASATNSIFLYWRKTQILNEILYLLFFVVATYKIYRIFYFYHVGARLEIFDRARAPTLRKNYLNIKYIMVVFWIFLIFKWFFRSVGARTRAKIFRCTPPRW